ncbi:hypothetical protein LXL04_006415 [Taraxacum kok-saghyz]
MNLAIFARVSIDTVQLGRLRAVVRNRQKGIQHRHGCKQRLHHPIGDTFRVALPRYDADDPADDPASLDRFDKDEESDGFGSEEGSRNGFVAGKKISIGGSRCVAEEINRGRKRDKYRRKQVRGRRKEEVGKQEEAEIRLWSFAAKVRGEILAFGSEVGKLEQGKKVDLGSGRVVVDNTIILLEVIRIVKLTSLTFGGITN